MASRRDGPDFGGATAGPLTAWRIADSRFPIYDGTGASLVGGRWNSPGHTVIYAGLTFAGAMLERLVHAGTTQLPKRQRLVRIHISARVSREVHDSAVLPKHWDAPDCVASRQFGDTWLRSGRTAVLLVPSVIAKYEMNVVINPSHRDARRIRVSEPEDVRWDTRLFRG